MDAWKELKNLGLKNLDKDALLGALGLQAKANRADFLVPALGLFGIGLLVGTGVGLIVAPRSGRETRRRLKKGVENVRDRAVTAINDELASAERSAASR